VRLGDSGPEFAEGAAILADAEPRVVVVDPPAAPWSPTSAPDETALILYTSDTAGLSKGVEPTGPNLGCALHEQQADIAGVLRLLVDRKVTHAVLVPTVLQRLLALPEARTADWSALSYVVYGASPIPLPVLRDAIEIIGCSFLQSYGLTESTGGFTLLGPGDHVPAEEFAHRLRSAGRPMRGARVRVVDADGYLYLHDRLTDMIVTGGENVYPAEVESVLTGHPAVAEVAVVGVPSARWGESPYAVVVLRPGAQVSEAELIAWTRDRLAHFKCPAGVSFAASLARTASGKLQKQAIRASLSSVAGQ
jgi:long-chain acyl-CoA synthetase